jgi:hypothetical protein
MRRSGWDSNQDLTSGFPSAPSAHAAEPGGTSGIIVDNVTDQSGSTKLTTDVYFFQRRERRGGSDIRNVLGHHKYRQLRRELDSKRFAVAWPATICQEAGYKGHSPGIVRPDSEVPMDDAIETKDSSDDKPSENPGKEPYQAPAFRCEKVFETAALSCGKVVDSQTSCHLNRKSS